MHNAHNANRGVSASLSQCQTSGGDDYTEHSFDSDFTRLSSCRKEVTRKMGALFMRGMNAVHEEECSNPSALKQEQETGSRSKSWKTLRSSINDVSQSDIRAYKSLMGCPTISLEHKEKLRQESNEVEVSGWVMPHNSTLRLRWDIAQAFVLLYLAVTVPLRIGFNLESQGIAYVIEIGVEIYFYFDMVFNFLTTYEDENMKIVVAPKAIARNYLRGWFLVDIISVLPVDLAIRIQDDMFPCSFSLEGCPATEGSSSSNAGQYVKMFKMFRLIRLVKLLRLVRLSRLVQKYQDELFSVLRIMATLKLIVLLLYLGHIFGCIFYFFSDDEWLTSYEKERQANGNFETWLHEMFDIGSNGTVNAPLTERYVAASYWAFTTMTTVGYGDISANSVAERTFAILGMIVGGLMLSTIVSKIIILFDEAHLHQKMMKEKMLQVEQWAKDLRLPKQTRSRILTFYRRQLEKPYDEGILLLQLPFEMRCLVAKHVYKDLIDTIPFFCEGDDMFRTQLCVGFKPLKLMPHRYIYLRGEIGRNMYVIQNGTVGVMDWKTNQPLSCLERGAYFGEGAALGDFRRRSTMKSYSMVHLLALNYNHMRELLELFPTIRLKMLTIYEKRLVVYNSGEDNLQEQDLHLTHNTTGDVTNITYTDLEDKSLLVNHEDATTANRDVRANAKKQREDFSNHQHKAEPLSMESPPRFRPRHNSLSDTDGVRTELRQLSRQMAEMMTRIEAISGKVDMLHDTSRDARII